jgi:hypothetical protein
MYTKRPVVDEYYFYEKKKFAYISLLPLALLYRILSIYTEHKSVALVIFP